MTRTQVTCSAASSPVYLVAHDGNMYDFPLLKAELENAGINLGIKLFCVDSYMGMKEIFKKKDEAKLFRQKEGETFLRWKWRL